MGGAELLLDQTDQVMLVFFPFATKNDFDGVSKDWQRKACDFYFVTLTDVVPVSYIDAHDPGVEYIKRN
jgi:hypothetical protein